MHSPIFSNPSDTACGSGDEALSRFLDNDLPSREAADLMIHLQKCPTCQAAYEQMQRTQSALRLLPAPGAPFGGPHAARVRVMERVERSVRLGNGGTTPTVTISPQKAWFAFPSRLFFAGASALSVAFVLGGAAFLHGSQKVQKDTFPLPVAAVVSLVPVPEATPHVPLPSQNEMAFLYHLHDARSAGVSTADPTDRRDCAAEARAALLRDTERIADNGAL